MNRLTRFGPLALLGSLLAFPCLIWAQGELAGRSDPSFRLNLLRTETVAPYAQQPPYDWSATYLGNAFSVGQSETNYVLDSSVCGYGVANTLQFGQEIKAYYSYADGQVSEILFKEESSPGVYDNFSRKLYTYTNGLQSGYLYQLWNENLSMWEDDYEEQTSYDGDGQVLTFRIREHNNGQWQNLFQQTYGYDTAGKVVEILAATWDNNSWLDTARTVVQYNDIGFYSRIFELGWNGVGWDSLTRETAGYGQLGMTWQTYLMEEKTANGWQGVVREQYEYDTYGFWTDMQRQAWDSNSSSWENLLREQFAYTRKGIWTQWSQQMWDGVDWAPAARQQYSLQDSVRADQLQVWDGAAWVNDSRALAQYDEDFNLVMEAATQTWDGTSDWENEADTRQCLHAWSRLPATAVEPALPRLSCTMTNPYRAYEPIFCESLQVGKRYDLHLIDMQGRTVYQKSVPGGERLSIDRTLPTGVYSLLIAEDQQRTFLRKIIIMN